MASSWWRYPYLEQIRDYLEVGIDRIIIGSMAVKNPDFVRAALEEFGADKIVVGIDAKAGVCRYRRLVEKQAM